MLVPEDEALVVRGSIVTRQGQDWSADVCSR